jgi:hypothetical protein
MLEHLLEATTIRLVGLLIVLGLIVKYAVTRISESRTISALGGRAPYAGKWYWLGKASLISLYMTDESKALIFPITLCKQASKMLRLNTGTA